MLGVFLGGRAKILLLCYLFLVPTRSDDRLDAGASQKKEWVTPKISLMEAGDTEGAKQPQQGETSFGGYGGMFQSNYVGPS